MADHGDPTNKDSSSNDELPTIDSSSNVADDSTVQLPFPMDSKAVQRQAKSKSNTPTEPAISTKKKEAKSTDEAARYEIESSVATGGMGRIYKARDERINRNVAFKVLLPRALERPALVDRFIDEAQITGQLEHPGIVPIYDLGKQRDGSPFYAMKMVLGETLGQAIAEYHQLDEKDEQRTILFGRLLRNFIDVCNAIAYAHGRGVLHRDLKPQNIMVGGYGETIVLDWGLAKILDPQQISTDSESDPDSVEHDTIHVTPSENETAVVSPVKRATGSMSRSTDTATEMGAVLGTPEFMPPEQARGALSELDFRSDTYSLGGILYQILTGYTPIPRDKSVKDKLALVIGGMIKPPRQMNPHIPKSIEAVCMKAMSLDRNDRYQTAKDLAADVERFLADEPVTAMAEPLSTQAIRWAKRNKTPVVAAVSTAIVASALLIGWNQVEAHRIQALRSDVSSLLEQVTQVEEKRDYEQAEDFLKQAATLLGLEDATELVELKQLYSEMNSRVERMRSVLDNVDRMMAESDQLLKEEKFEESLKVILAAEDLVENREEFKDSHVAIVTKRSEVSKQFDESVQRQSKQRYYREFVKLADEARFYGTRFTGESAEDAASKTKEQALAALRVFELDQPSKVFIDPDYLDTAELSHAREVSFELWMILADAIRDEAAAKTTAEQVEASKEALKWLDKAALAGVSSRALAIRRAELLGNLGRMDEAKAAQQLADNTIPNTALDHFLLGEMKRKAGQYNAALRSYGDTLDINSNHFWAQNFSGLCNLQLKKFEAAKHCYDMCSKARPDFVWTYLTLAVAEGKLGNIDESIKQFDKAETLENDNYGLYLNRGVIYSDRLSDAINETEQTILRGDTVSEETKDQILSDYKSAVADFQRAKELGKRRYRPRFNLGETHRRMAYWMLMSDAGEIGAQPYLTKAGVELTQSIDLVPKHANSYEVRANVHWMKKDFAAAIDDNKQAIKLYQLADAIRQAPERVATCFQQLGGAYFDQGNLNSARLAYESAIETGAYESKVVAELANVQLKDKEYQKAVNNFSRYLAMFPAELSSLRAKAEVLEARAEALSRLGKFEAAMDDYTQALQLKGYSDTDIIIRRGWSYLNNNFKLAQLDFMRAERLQINNPEVHAGLGTILAMTGRYTDAKKSAQKAEKLLDELDPAKLANLNANDQASYMWGQHMNIAIVYVQIIAKQRIDPNLLVPERISSEQANTLKAKELLETSFKIATEQDQIGDALDHFRKDSFFDVIRNSASIKNLIKRYTPAD